MDIQLSHVGLTIADKTLLDDISFKVEAGEFVTISGPSGSGKSTLLRVIASLLTPTSGEIVFNGQKQADYKKTDYRRLVSYCFQQPSLFGETIADNLAFPFKIRQLAFDQERAKNALASVELGHLQLDKPITELSGGEKQRVALIRNLLFAPKILLLDEITTGLDAENKAIVQTLVHDFANHDDHAVIAVTHDESEIAAATRLLTVVDGRLEDTDAK